MNRISSLILWYSPWQYLAHSKTSKNMCWVHGRMNECLCWNRNLTTGKRGRWLAISPFKSETVTLLFIQLTKQFLKSNMISYRCSSPSTLILRLFSQTSMCLSLVLIFLPLSSSPRISAFWGWALSFFLFLFKFLHTYMYSFLLPGWEKSIFWNWFPNCLGDVLLFGEAPFKQGCC